MIQAADPVTVSVPRAILSSVAESSAEFLDRMHELLEKNTDGQLSTAEKTKLEQLVRIAEFGQIVSAALHLPSST